MMKRGFGLFLGLVAVALYAIFYGQKTVDVTVEAVKTMLKKAPLYAGKASPYDDLINFNAAANGIDPLLIRAVIRQESNWDPAVPGFDGLSIGLMQITLPLAHDYFHRDSNFDELADPETSIKIGAWYLGKLTRSYNGDLNKILDAYNEGPGNVNKGIDISYSDSVLAFYQQYKDAAALPEEA